MTAVDEGVSCDVEGGGGGKVKVWVWTVLGGGKRRECDGG